VLRFVNLTLAGVSSGLIYAAVGLALVLIWRSTRIVNFAQGGMMMITTFVAYTVVQHGGSYWVALAAALAAGAVLGAVAELLVRPVEGGPPLNAVIVTLGLLVFLQAVAGMIFGGTPRSFSPAFSIGGYQVGGTRLLFSPADTFILAAVVVVMVALAVLFRRTSAGLRMRAAAFAPEVARLLGVRVGRTLTLGWVLAAVVGALAGALVAPLLYVNPTLGGSLGIKGFAAAILGGFGNIGGAIVGGLAIGVLDSFAAGHFQAYSELVVFLAFTVIIMIKPTGLFGERTVNRA
jgi:branched-chain amino acid transport system permease protein